MMHIPTVPNGFQTSRDNILIFLLPPLQHMNVILAQKKLQLELVEAKFAKSSLEVQQDRESSLREKKNMIKVSAMDKQFLVAI